MSKIESRESFEGAGLPMPKIENAYGGVKVTFQRKNVNSGQTSGQTTKDIIYSLMKKNPEITRAEIGKVTGKSQSYLSTIC